MDRKFAKLPVDAVQPLARQRQQVHLVGRRRVRPIIAAQRVQTDHGITGHEMEECITSGQSVLELDVIEEASTNVHAALEVADGPHHRRCRRGGVWYVPSRRGKDRRNRVPHVPPKPIHVIIHSGRIAESVFDNSKCHGKCFLCNECQGRFPCSSDREPPIKVR
jgi:hypothetical protein